ncbi:MULTISPECIES: aldehyde dehydrogenase [Actinomadura]|jgi:aminomuconate-semialdehyde/2-hydroxymuconate-6-semialdehyde dehydrogenase|uniref:Aminomuconate-semialdehyde/2-hydroxymuconate-6-semialdehyde dehydrogenase n=1 Tax=Actinomadura citrea TaxID=46158 RepID=A0A7Y9GJN1_9ACTN|nr:aldehyde dehydrogenase [Actinomadura citrea]NYE17624.1 aminomuconate-semialdehyde/2-hydroxymuconate-6-semialdehyde dehydrogenase [Actinomadura citrea]GGT60614.1 aldehyde dehydrogenase [Actinomadura citrea]
MNLIPHVIDGRETESRQSSRFSTVDPYTRRPWAEVALGGREEAGLAVTAARRAFDEGPWPRMGYAERGAILHRLADLVEANIDELSLADTTDMGKPVSDTRGKDVPRSAYNFRFFADHARLSAAEALPMDSGHHAYTRFEPAGVVAAIAPWNFPLMLETWKIAPALAWGNTVVLKPAEQTPASASLLARLALEAGMPPGVLNVVHGYGPGSVGEALTRDPRVDRITFTGESATGRAIAGAAAANLTPVSFELGGKGANLVFADADLDLAASWSIKAIFSNAGQVCLAGSRLFVQREVYQEFLDRFIAAAEALVPGDPKDPATQLGPLASEEHYAKVKAYLDGVPGEGGKIATGGVGAEGLFVRPTVVLDAPPTARVRREEIFGPVAVVTPFDTENEAVAAANDTPYGLNAMVFTENLSRAHRVSAALKAGTVWTNCFFIRDLRAPFGGVGDSGLGREGGTYSREFFTEPKAVVMAIDTNR